jgi:predicted nuclease with TOPRIM domain
MKNKILSLAITGMIAMVGLTATAQENKKAAEARKDLKEAKIDSAEDFHKFKKEAEGKIKENQAKIAELKAKKSGESKEVNKRYDKKVLALEQKNNELKNKIRKADDTKTSMWTSFKREFNHEMDKLGLAFKDMNADNSK